MNLVMPTVPSFPKTRIQIAGISVEDLVQEFGTPTFVYDAKKIIERINDLQAFDVVRYAQKANSNLAVLNLVRRQGALVDTVSAGEIHRALRVGYETVGDPPPIIYTADIFDRESLKLCVERNIHVNCGSPDMIDQLGERAPGREITLRINPGFGHGHSQKTNTGGEQSKHGIWHEQVKQCVARAEQCGLQVTGLHLHIGSGTDLVHLSQVCQAMERLGDEVGSTIRTISAGGGLPIPYQEGESYIDLSVYYELWDAARKRLENSFGHPVRLEIEPGRYVVGESGFLITEIRAVKQMGSNTYYLVDAGFNNLARPILYGSHHPMSIALTPADGGSRPMRNVVVGGPLCESGDIFTQSEGGFVRKHSLPEARVGEFLLIECVGAYGFVMSSNYNSQPMAAEVLIHDGKSHLVRRRQTADDMIQGELLAQFRSTEENLKY